jgi:tetratricopeptide (TPR) repeat protein
MLYAIPSDKLILNKGDLSNIEVQFFKDIDDGELNNFSMYDGFLIASNITDEQNFKYYQYKLLNIKTLAVKNLNQNTDSYTLGKDLLKWMHDNVLIKYSESASDAIKLLDNGDYNCLSSSILYALLAKDLNLNVDCIITKKHSFCVLHDKKGDIDIETTARYGFDPGTKEIERLGKDLMIISVPKSEYKLRQSVTLKELIGCVYTNNIDDNTFKDYNIWIKTLVSLGKAYYYYDNDTQIHDQIIANIINLMNYCINQNDFENAKLYFAKLNKFEPQYDKLSECNDLLWCKIAKSYLEQKDYYKAIDAVHEGLKFNKESLLIKRIGVFCYNKWGLSFAENGDYLNAIRLFNQGNAECSDEVITTNLKICYYKIIRNDVVTDNYANFKVHYSQLRVLNESDSELVKFTVEVFSKMSINFIKKNKFRESINVIKDSLVFYPGNKELLEELAISYDDYGRHYVKSLDYVNSIKIYEEAVKLVKNKDLLHNMHAVYNNYLILLCNKKNYVEAKIIYNKALQFFPGDTKFISFNKQIQNGLKRIKH